MRRSSGGRIAALISLLVFCSSLLSAQVFPKPSGRVNDFANVIDQSVESEIDSRLDLLEQQTSSEIAVATVTSLDGMSVDEYANRLFKEWGVGQAKQDNGVLVLVAPKERDMRIEVGYGLEGVLPDGLAGQVIRERFTPRFRDGDYSGGIRNGVTHLADIVQKHQVLTAEEIAALNQPGVDVLPWILIPFLGLFVTIGFGMLGIGLSAKAGFPLLFGSLFGGIPLLLSAIGGKIAVLILFPYAAIMTGVGFFLGRRYGWGELFRDSLTGSGSSSSSKGSRSSTGSRSASSSSSSWSSSSSSGSSSSFGGGSSGGGGASGKW